MKVESFPYVLNDGNVSHVSVDLMSRVAVITLNLREQIAGGRYRPIRVQLRFSGLKEFYINEDFPTDGNYSDVVFVDGEIDCYLALDPFDNSGLPNEKDNWIFRAVDVAWEQV